MTFRVASAGSGGRIELRLDAITGPLVATATVTPTGGWQTYKDITVPVTDPGGTHALYFVFRNEAASGGLLNLNWTRFHGPGVGVPAAVAPGLLASYYPTADFTGAPAERTDPQVSFDWRRSAPLAGIPTNNFSVRWDGWLRVPTSGTYRFTAASDDGMRIYVNGALAVDAWEGLGFRQLSGTAALTAGGVPIRIEYRDLSGDAEAAVLWSGPGVSNQPLRSDFLWATTDGATDTESAETTPFQLLPARPNPSRTRADLAFDLQQPGPATVDVYDLLGRRVLRLFDGAAPAGRTTLRADVSGLASGMYLVRLLTDEGTRTQRLTVVR